MVIRRMNQGQSIQFGDTVFSERMVEARLLADPTQQINAAVSTAVASAVSLAIASALPGAVKSEVTADLPAAVQAAVAAATPGIQAAAVAAAQSAGTTSAQIATASFSQTITDLTAQVSAALAAATAAQGAVSALPAVKGGVYAVTAADVTATYALIPTGLTTLTSAIAQLYDSNNILLTPSLAFSFSGTSIKVAKNGLLWTPVAGQKINWIAIGK